MTEWWEEEDAYLKFPAKDGNFWRKVDIRGKDDCWLWLASKDKDGYGRYRHGRKIFQSNIFAYHVTKGDIPKGYVILHSCDNPPCCNPNHLSSGTHLDNMLDMVAKKRDKNGLEPQLTHEQIKMCRESFWYQGVKAEDLAILYDIPRPTMDSLVLGRSWGQIHPFCEAEANFHSLRGRESIPFCEKHKETMGKYFNLRRPGAKCRHVEG